MRRQPHSPRSRSAYTLLELLLALAVMAVLAGVTIPSALRMYADTKLTDAAEKVRALVGQTRMHAISTGERFQFRYEKDGSHYLQVPLEVPAPVETDNATVPTLPRPKSTLGILPDGLRFTTEDADVIQTGGTPGPPLIPELLNELPDSKDLVSLSWSAAIVFAEDGSASDATWLVVDSRNQAIPVEVRGLTGAASLGAMFQYKDR